MIIENYVQLMKTPLKKMDTGKLHPIIKELADNLKISPKIDYLSKHPIWRILIVKHMR
jgi:hypothetical protein